jgi:hypothetical protein
MQRKSQARSRLRARREDKFVTYVASYGHHTFNDLIAGVRAISGL